MRKILLFFCAVIIVSCCTHSNDDKIKETFSEYVNQNFDDPSKVQEIVSITYDDTLTNKSFAEMVSELSMMSDSLESLSTSYTKKANSLANRYGSKFRYNQSFKDDWDEYVESQKHKVEKLWELAAVIWSNDITPISKDSILKYDDFALLGFTIKYRINENEDLKLEDMRGYVDLKSSTIYMGEQKNTDLLMFLEGVNQVVNYYKTMIEINSDIIRKTEKVISYFE